MELELRWLPNIEQPERQELRLKGCSPPFMMLSRRTPPWTGAHQCTTLKDRDIQSNTAWLWGAGTLCCLPGRMLGGWSSGDSVEEDLLMCHPREMNKASGVLTQDMPLLGKHMHSTMGAVSLTLRCELPSPAADTSAFSSVLQLVTVGGRAPAPPVSGIRATLVLSHLLLLGLAKFNSLTSLLPAMCMGEYVCPHTFACTPVQRWTSGVFLGHSAPYIY